MNVVQRRRSLSRTAFQWLGGFSSSFKRAIRRDEQTAAAGTISWSSFDRLQFVVNQPYRTTMGGEHRSRQRAPSPDFADYRPYQHGDDVRRIDWNVYGRLGVLQMRQTEAQRRVPVLILLDCSASMNWGEPNKLGFARDLALALSRVGLARSDSVSIACLGHGNRRIGPASGIRQFGPIVQFLNGTSPARKIDINAEVQVALEQQGPRRSAPGLVFLISDFLSVTDVDALLACVRSAAGSAVALHVVSREEAEPEAIGDVDLVDAESGQIVEVGLSVDTLRHYRERYESWRSGLERKCGMQGIRYVSCTTERSIQEVILSDLRAGRVIH